MTSSEVPTQGVRQRQQETSRKGPTERLGDLFGFRSGERGLGLGRGDPIRIEQLNRLVLVDREVSSLLPVPGGLLSGRSFVSDPFPFQL